MSSTSVSIIGTGTVASSLAHALLAKGIKVNEIYSRTLARAKKLSGEIPGSNAKNSLDFVTSESDIFIFAISDDAIEKVSKQVLLPQGTILAHTSGTVSMNILEQSHSGIFYPLQTFTNSKKVDFEKVPILIDGKNQTVIEELTKLAGLLSKEVKTITESERQKLHIAAVFASNFTNRMLASAEEILKDTSLDLKIFESLVKESIQNAFNSNPDHALTGPAKRGDKKTIDSHIKQLENKPQLKEIYEKITQMIISKT